MTPALADFLYQRNVVALIATAGFDGAPGKWRERKE